VGRRVEQASIDALLDAIPQGGFAVLFHGEAGIGKTTLWQHGVTTALSRGLRVTATRAAAGESSLSYSGLADLVGDASADELAELPDPQRASLERALSRTTGGTVEALGVALAVAHILQTRSREQPLLVALDDIQWLDEATATVLSFALRRLTTSPIGLIASQRTGETDPPLDLQRTFPHLRQVAVQPLGVAEIAELVSDRLGCQIAATTARTIHRATDGNPFFAVELADAIGPKGRLPEEEDIIPDGLRALLARRLEGLSDAGRKAVVVVAASGHPERGVVERLVPHGMAEALSADVLRSSGARIYPRHPLLGTIAYEDAGPRVRAAVHRLLAEAARDEERALHLALATTSADEAVASELEEAAGGAIERGALREGGILAAHALRVTPADARSERLRRGVLACEMLLAAGDLERVRGVGDELLFEFPEGEEAARVLIPLARAREEIGESIDLLRRALELATERATLARIHFELADLLEVNEGFGAGAANLRAAAELAAESDPRMLSLALAGLAYAEFFLGKGIDRELIDRATRLEKRFHSDLSLYASPTSILARMLLWTDDFRAAGPLLERIDARAAATGAEDERTGALLHLGELAYRAGDTDKLTLYAAELRRLSWELDLVQVGTARYVDALAAVLRGEADAARALAREGIETAANAQDEIFRAQASWVLGFAELLADDADAAHSVLAPLPDTLDRIGILELALAPALALDAEALVLLGRINEAEELTKRLEHRARSLGRQAGRAAAARSRMLILAARGDIHTGIDHGTRAIELHERVGEPFERARTLLLLGTVQRRAGRKRAARETLEQARDAFHALGSDGWADKASAEIRRIGGRAAASRGLSEMERRIALLAADGRTNREIAAAAFISVKTVEATLTKAYRKLGVRSRTELARVVDGET